MCQPGPQILSLLTVILALHTKIAGLNYSYKTYVLELLIKLCQRHTQTSLSHPSYIWRLLLVLASDVTSCIVAALRSVCQSVSSSRLGAAVVGISEISW